MDSARVRLQAFHQRIQILVVRDRANLYGDRRMATWRVPGFVPNRNTGYMIYLPMSIQADERYLILESQCAAELA